MRIGVIGSMQFTERMVAVRDELDRLGHSAFVTDLHRSLLGKSDEEKERIKLHQKANLDAIREFWRAMQGADAVLVLNYDKNGVRNYIGANTFLEMGFAHVLGQKVFVLNELPDDGYLRSELEAFKPVVISRDFSLIR